ncbi:MAG: tol-pal system protein YbgF [Nitrospiraceae bacterium]
MAPSSWILVGFSRAWPLHSGTTIALLREKGYRDLAEQYGGITMKTLMIVLQGMIAVLFSLNLAVAAPSNMQDSSRHLYDRVMEEYKHRDYEAALAGFRFFLELHGHSSLAANAQYWVGECQYRLGRYKEALKSFYHVVSYYPLSPKLTASTLKIGQTYTRLKDHEKARLMYERVIDDYPESAEAELARKALDAAPMRDEEPTSQLTGNSPSD